MDLAGLDAHTPIEVTREGMRRAAVLVPLIERPDGPAILFTERSPDLDAHAGEMAFPGGGYEEEDSDLAGTALREAYEEIDLHPEEALLVGRLDDIPGPYGHVVRPFVGWIPDRTYDPDEREVAAVVVLSVADLTDPVNYRIEERETPDDRTVGFPWFEVDGHVVWGLTGFILARFLSLTTDWDPPGGFPHHPLMDEHEQWAEGE